MKTLRFALTIILIILFAEILNSQILNQANPVTARLTLLPGQSVAMLDDLLPPGSWTLESNNTVLVKTNDPDLLRSLGCSYRIIDGPGSVKMAVKTFSTASLTADPTIQAIVDSVSVDTIMNTIINLQNFGTRYEYTPTQDSAAVYLYKEFQRWGFDVDYDTFALGTSTVYDLDYVAPDVGWICGTGGLIAYTTDGGSSWTNQSSGFTSSFYGMDFVSSTTGWVVSDGGIILQSTDGGVTWSPQSSPYSSTLYDVMFTDDQLGLIVGVSGRILRTTNGGVTWASIASGTTNTLRKVSFVDSRHAWAVGGVPGSNGIVLCSTDGGLNWSTQTIPSSSGYLRGVCFIDSLHGWTTGDGPTILKTTNGGINWIAKTPPWGIGSILRGTSFIDLLEGWTVDYYGQLLHTTDGGESWSISYTSPADAYFIDLCAFNLERITIIGTESTILTSTDGGSSWISQTTNLPSQFFHYTQNVVATLPGIVSPDTDCVIVGHYDSNSDDPYVSAPGANDNATGTCAVLEVARLCRNYRFKYTMKFLAVAAEEVGLIGSSHYASSASSEGKTILGVVNGDMTGYPTTGDTTRLVVTSYQNAIPLLDSIGVYNIRYGIGVNLVSVVSSSGGSDHVPFTNYGYNAVEIAEATADEIWGGADPYYHSVNDTYDRISPGMVRRAVQLETAALAELARPVSGTTYAITATAGPGGSINPSGVVLVDSAGSQRFTFNPATGYHVDSVLVDGTITDSIVGYTFANVTEDHTILVKFAKNIYTITASSVVNGHIVPEGEIKVPYGDSQTFSMVPDSGYRVERVNVDGLNKGSLEVYVFNSVSSDHTIDVTFDILMSQTTISMNSNWNIISVPLVMTDMSKNALFPFAISGAFMYHGEYIESDTLQNGVGYWIKFPADTVIALEGINVETDSVPVLQGWNLIGTVSHPVMSGLINSIPPAIQTSDFFQYAGSYEAADTLEPGKGYWIKVSEPGVLILSGSGNIPATARIHIVPTSEPPLMPPNSKIPNGIGVRKKK
jgi:photosystem II stability/assembly factor-like uncharacterized protein